jgi:hypothetical protein
MPQYMLLIYNPPTQEEAPPEMHERWAVFTESLKDAGLLVAGDALQGVETATTLREQGGQVQITDGPFAETKEYLAGYYVLEAPNLDTVLEHARHTPNLGSGSVEVRPVWDLSQGPVAAEQTQARA